MLERKKKKEERNYLCPFVYNLVGKIRNRSKITESIWRVYPLSNMHSQSTEETTASVGYNSYRFMEEAAI